MLAPSNRFGGTMTIHPLVRKEARRFYASTIRQLTLAGVPHVVGGAFALAYHAGIARDTKDLDIFLKREDCERALEVLRGHGCTTELTFPHWLGKAYRGENFVDFIFNSANGLCPVDDAWIDNAVPTTIWGVPTMLCPIEEMIWSKSFVMERERYDGADVCHLIEAKGEVIDWKRLVARFGPHWRILLGHLVTYSYVYPSRRHAVPDYVMDELMARMERERHPEHIPVCRGTNISREQYLVDLRERGYEDARVAPWGVCREEHIAYWTDAIGKIK